VKTFPIKKRINTELFIEVGALLTKVKEGSDKEDQIKKISDLSEEGKILSGNNCSGGENRGSLFR